MGRAPCCDKANVKKGPWSPEEDAKLKSYIDQHGTGGNWIALPQKIGLKRCGKSCRLRWLNYLRPNIRHGGFSEEEDNIICSLYISIGSRWSIIAAQLPGRTDNDIKNYWNTRLKKKLLGKQRKEKQVRGKQKSSAISNDSQNPMMYSPQLPSIFPIPYTNEEPHLTDHTSIRKLLIKLGGRFSDGSEYPMINESSITKNMYINNSVDLSTPADQFPFLNAISAAYDSSVTDVPQFGMNGMDMNTMLQESNINLSAEAEPMMYESPEKLQGFEFFYDDHDILNSSSTCGERIDWGQMSFLGFPANNNDGFLQESTLEELVVEKMRHP
ncbi:hypothetical protein BUALT_Bualt08G0032200 [Buddleja alternifolia]|uniref:Transcription factor RAX3 n=1 Tax=Buddleja alternifolia TaxID=168488 RepID=A0AAV6XAI9_9LAMI|nr:hypothetical protein BUALT_Bualt08G0032200 [Buddleja alternifolia]